MVVKKPFYTCPKKEVASITEAFPREFALFPPPSLCSVLHSVPPSLFVRILSSSKDSVRFAPGGAAAITPLLSRKWNMYSGAVSAALLFLASPTTRIHTKGTHSCGVRRG